MKRYAPALLVLWLVLLGGNWTLYVLVLPVRMAHHIIITAILVGWLVRRGLPRTPINAPLLAAGVCVAISVWAAVDPRMALENALFWLINALLFLMLIDLVQRGYTDQLAGGLFVSGGLIAGVGLVQFVATGQRPASLLFITNEVAAFCAPLALLAAGWWLASKRRELLVLALALVALVVVNQSRGAILSLMVGAAVLAALQHTISRKRLIALMVVAVIGVGGLSLVQAHRSGDSYRLDLWRAAVSMSIDHPATGVGLGLFGLTYNSRYGERAEQYALGAHNIILNTLAETGIGGLVSGAILALFWLAHVPTQRSVPQNAALAALAGLAAHSLFDYMPFQSIAVLILLCAAILTPLEAAQRARRLALLPAGGLMVAVLLFARFDLAQIFYERSLITCSPKEAATAYSIDPLALYFDQAFRLVESPLCLTDTPAPAEMTTDFALVGYGRYWR